MRFSFIPISLLFVFAGNTCEEPVEPDDEPATVSGTVWAPGNAPGLVPAQHEIPIAHATILLSTSAPSEIPDKVHCAACVSGADIV